jgi:hypothetical protein
MNKALENAEEKTVKYGGGILDALRTHLQIIQRYLSTYGGASVQVEIFVRF